jgi:hypothetical protein
MPATQEIMTDQRITYRVNPSATKQLFENAKSCVKDNSFIPRLMDEVDE